MRRVAILAFMLAGTALIWCIMPGDTRAAPGSTWYGEVGERYGAFKSIWVGEDGIYTCGDLSRHQTYYTVDDGDMVYKWDFNGNKVWERYLTGATPWCGITGDTNYIYCFCGYRMYKLDHSGNVVQTTEPFATAPGEDFLCFDACTSPDGIYVCGDRGDYNVHFDMFVALIDATTCTLVWNKTKVFSESSTALGVRATPSNVFVCGQIREDSVMIVWDDTGTEIRSKTYQGSEDFLILNALDIDAAGDITVAGSHSGNVLLMHMNQTLGSLWNATGLSGGGLAVWSDSSGYYVGGNKDVAAYKTTSDIQLSKVNLNGNVVWSRTWRSEWGDLEDDVCWDMSGRGENLYVAGKVGEWNTMGRPLVMSWDTNGNVSQPFSMLTLIIILAASGVGVVVVIAIVIKLKKKRKAS
ncbi:MAG: hypothetical protein JW839_07585 [Candidatus Lokiarchaeota archaeon]|nr:hypothetical protein [Candidatus Lokiarchaeota archaeon]